MTIIRRWLFVGLALLFTLPAPRGALCADLEDIGVVFLHGKGLWAGAFDGGLINALHEGGRQGPDAGNAVVLRPYLRRNL